MLRDSFFWGMFFVIFALLCFTAAAVRYWLHRQGALGYRGRRRRSHR